jgi:hypothetical protein
METRMLLRGHFIGALNLGVHFDRPRLGDLRGSHLSGAPRTLPHFQPAHRPVKAMTLEKSPAFLMEDPT